MADFKCKITKIISRLHLLYGVMWHCSFSLFDTLPHDSGGLLWFQVACPCDRPSIICPSVCIFIS